MTAGYITITNVIEKRFIFERYKDLNIKINVISIDLSQYTDAPVHNRAHVWTFKCSWVLPLPRVQQSAWPSPEVILPPSSNEEETYQERVSNYNLNFVSRKHNWECFPIGSEHYNM